MTNNNKSLKILGINQRFTFKFDNLSDYKVIEFKIETDKKNEVLFKKNFEENSFISKKIKKNFKKNIVYKETIDMNIAWKQSRYDKGDGDDYINCPLTKSEYFKLIKNIKNSSKTEFKDFENTPFFESCLPIEEMIRSCLLYTSDAADE